MEKPLVSILIPFKNTEVYLKECIDSILEQKYPHWEILAVDDHSIDDSRKVMDAYADLDSRIKVLQNKGTGIIEALRLAFSVSKGDFVTRMDSDDVMAPTKLASMVAALQTLGKGHLAVGKVTYFSERGISNGYERYEKWLNDLTETGSNFSELYKECVIPSPCWMAYRRDLEACGAFNTDRYPEDYDLTFRFFEKGLQCIPCKEVLHFWRDYDTRTSRTSVHYAQNYFLDIKLHYFLILHYQPNNNLVLWGAGTKGKTIAKQLVERQIDFKWLCDNPNKIGKQIYGKEMLHFKAMQGILNPQSIITVANAAAQAEIRSYLALLGQCEMKDYFFFC